MMWINEATKALNKTAKNILTPGFGLFSGNGFRTPELLGLYLTKSGFSSKGAMGQNDLFANYGITSYDAKGIYAGENFETSDSHTYFLVDPFYKANVVLEKVSTVID